VKARPHCVSSAEQRREKQQVLHGREATKKQNRRHSRDPFTMQRAKRPDAADVALGRRLKSLRVRRGLSQTALGEVLGVSFQQIQKYERGANRIRVSQLGRLAEALAVSAGEFLEIPRTEGSEIADMIDTRVARRLMNAFQSLASRERRCLAALVEAMAARQ
jgi:transcriptional regulator with XRE-family HTH domain